METEVKKIAFPENLYLRDKIKEANTNIAECARQIGVSRLVLSKCVNGHYKGINLVPKLTDLLNNLLRLTVNENS